VNKSDVTEPLERCALTGELEQRGRQVDTEHRPAACDATQVATKQTATAADVQHNRFLSNRCSVDEVGLKPSDAIVETICAIPPKRALSTIPRSELSSVDRRHGNVHTNHDDTPRRA